MTATTSDAAIDVPVETDEPQDEVLAEILVEEISIDGMCGVY
jgi:mycofactocin precursor